MSNTINPFDSIKSTMAFDSRDWSIDKRDAWIYGIVWGWAGVWSSIAKNHKWSDVTLKRLKLLHKEFTRAVKSRNKENA